MDRIGVVGIAWTKGGASALARFTVPQEDRPRRAVEIARGVGAEEFVYLATCNRVEVAFVTDGETPVSAYRGRIFAALAGTEPAPGEAARTFRAWAGEGAVEHLFLVAAGLASARPGETEIAGQLRLAYETAKEAGLVGPRLELVLDEALKVAGRVHAATAVGEGKVSLAELALDRVRARLAAGPGKVALVGVSPMTERCAKGLPGERVVVVNRTLARAEALAASCGGAALGLEEFRRDPAPVVALVLATGAKTPVLARSTLEKLAARSPSGEPPLVVDMAVPPNVAPADADAAGLPRIGMDEIIREAERNRSERIVELAEARALVDEALAALRRKLADRLMAPLIAALQRRYQRTADEGVERLVRKELKGLGDEEREAVRRWAETLARRFAHIPSLGIRALAEEIGSGAVETFLSGLGDELGAELRAAARGGAAIAAPREEAP